MVEEERIKQVTRGNGGREYLRNNDETKEMRSSISGQGKGKEKDTLKAMLGKRIQEKEL